MKAETWHLTFLIVESTVVVCLNTFLVITIIINRKLRSRICNLFLTNLFLAHIMEGLVGIMRSSVFYSIVKDPVKVSMGVNLFTTAVILSYLTYIPVTLDRYAAIKHPFRYQQLTYQHVILINSLIWLTAIIFGMTVFSLGMDSKVGDGITSGATLFMCVLCISANVSIYKVVKEQVKKLKVSPVISDDRIQRTSMTVSNLNTPVIARSHKINHGIQQKSVTVSNLNTPVIARHNDSFGIQQTSMLTIPNAHTPGTAPENHKDNSEISKEAIIQDQRPTAEQDTNKKTEWVEIHTRKRSVAIQKLNTRSLRSLRICTLIVVSFIICWLPHTLHDILKITKAFPSIVYSDSLLARSTIFIAFCNGIIDPVLYVFMNRDLKELLKRFFRRVKNRARTNTLS